MKSLRKIIIYTVAIILAAGVTSALDINSSQNLDYFNDGTLQFQVDTSGNIQSYGNLDLGGNSVTSFFGSACPSGQTVVDVGDDGSFQCMDVSNEVSGDYVSRSGDSMTGSLDMNRNNLNGVDQISSSVDGNDFWTLSDASGGSNTAPYTMRFDTRDWRLWAGDTGQTVMQLSQDGTVEIPSGDLSLGGNSITNFFGSACPSGQTVVDVNDDGTFQCMDVSNEVAGDYVSRSGDSMNGNLDMSGNNVNNVNKIQLNNIESVSDGQIGRDNSIGYLGNWGGNGNAVLWDSYNVQGGNAISITGGTGDESNPQISVSEGSISHDNIGGVSYNDHHGLGNALTWDGSNNPAVSSGGIGSNEIASGAVSTTELDTGDVDTRYVNRGGDSMSGNLDISGTVDVDGSSAPLIVTESGGSSLHLGGNEIDSVNDGLHLQNNNGGNVNVRSNLDMYGNTITNADVHASNGLQLPTGTDAW